jgi:hypothetical protein
VRSCTRSDDEQLTCVRALFATTGSNVLFQSLERIVKFFVRGVAPELVCCDLSSNLLQELADDCDKLVWE